VKNAIYLTKALMVVHGVPAANRLRHYDISGKSCPRPWVNDESQWRAFLAALKGDVDVSREEAKKIVKQKAGLSDTTIQYIADDYRHGDELIIKLAEAMK
jgi:N-acetylmuramoyl-L-alanine amidase CwlA